MITRIQEFWSKNLGQDCAAVLWFRSLFGSETNPRVSRYSELGWLTKLAHTENHRQNSRTDILLPLLRLSKLKVWEDKCISL